MIRYSPEVADAALVPVDLPLDVLVGGLGRDTLSARLALDDSLGAFRTVWGSRLDATRLKRLLQDAAYDIVHLSAGLVNRQGLGAWTPVRAEPNWIDVREVVDRLTGERAQDTANLLALLGRKRLLVDRARRHLRFKALLQIWLWAHVPLSFALLAALVAHVVAVFFYR